jgi:hypothetical protein
MGHVSEDLVQRCLRTRVGRAAFKKGSTLRVVAMSSHFPHASHPSTFRAPGWGAPALPSSCCWRSTTLRRWAPFSHRSASRIFIRQPGCIPSPMVTQDGDHQFDGGEKQAGLRPLPRPQLQGSSSSLSWRGARRAGVPPPAWAGGRPPPSAFRGEGAHRPGGGGGLWQRGAIRPQASSAPACLASWLWDCFRCHLPPPGRGVAVRPPCGGCCVVRTGGPPKTSHAARAAFVFLDCPVPTPARHLCAEVGASPSGRT